MPPPAQVTQWLRTTYPKPTVDPAWLEGCYEWIESELQLNPAKDMDAIIYNIETQLMQSNLSDSMLAGTGLPHDVAELDNTKLTGAPVLVEVVSITEIGHSAFNLQNVRQARIERADLAGLAEQEDAGEGQEGEDDGPIPKYPRGMLKLELSDGSTTLQAIEYRRLPDLELGSTPLGYKMLLKNVFVRRGIAWLEPGNVVLKGYQTEERQAMADTIFVRGLRKRLGKPEDDPIPPIPNGGRAENAAPQQAPAPQAPPPQPPAARSPLSPIKEPPEPPAAGPSNGHDDDIEQPRRRKLPARPRTPSPDPPPRKPLSSSRFFAESSGTSGRARKLATELKLSPHRQAPLPPAPDDIDGDGPGPSRKPPRFEGSKGRDVVVHLDDDVVASGGDASNASPRSSDYEFGFEFDGELLEKLDQVEKQAYGETETVARSTTVVSRSVHVSPARPAIDLEVITIDDDDEGQEEKENVPVPTRHVRRRIQDEDIIELSD